MYFLWVIVLSQRKKKNSHPRIREAPVVGVGSATKGDKPGTWKEDRGRALGSEAGMFQCYGHTFT